ncbi:Major facilitator superfamily domain-containing protein 7 [Botrytis cinerea]
MEVSTQLNSNGLEKSIEEKTERNSDTDRDETIYSDEEKDPKIGYKETTGDSADSIQVGYTEDSEKGIEKEKDRTPGENKEEDLGIGEIGIIEKGDKERNIEKETHYHHAKGQENGSERAVLEEEVEDIDDLDLSELNSGDDLLPDEEEGGVRRGGTGVDGAADEGLRRRSSERNVAGSNAGNFRVYKRRWFGLVQLVLLNIVVSWDWLTFSASSTTVSQYYNVSESAINWLSTAFLFAFVLASPFVIYVLHHGGPKPAIVISSVLLLLGNWIRYGATRSGPHGNFGGVMFGQILTGVAQPFVLAAPTRYSDLWFTNQGRVAATAVMSLANPFGGALAQLIDPFWAGSVGSIPNMVLYISIISTIATIPSFFIPKEPPTPCSASSEEPKHALGASLRFLLRSPEFYMMMFPFWFYVGLFNSISSLINQMLSPYSFSETDAGIAGALLIVVGLVAAAITSPLIDRTKTYLLAIKIQIPILGICYLAFTWAPQTRSLAAIYAILSILGAASFSLVPVALEYLIEITHPVSPEVTSTICWSGGQLLGGIFIIASDKLRAGGFQMGPRMMGL